MAAAADGGTNGLCRNGLNRLLEVNTALCACSEGTAALVNATDISKNSSHNYIFPDVDGATQLSLYGNSGGGTTPLHLDVMTTKLDRQGVGLPGELRKVGIRPMVTYKDGSTVDGLDSVNFIIGNGQAVSDACYHR
jgi:hypothetical protein